MALGAFAACDDVDTLMRDTSYYRALYYDSAVGRFLSEDPQERTDPNLYVYVHDNPTNAQDP